MESLNPILERRSVMAERIQKSFEGGIGHYEGGSDIEKAIYTDKFGTSEQEETKEE